MESIRKHRAGLVLGSLAVLVLAFLMQDRLQAAFSFQSPLPAPESPCYSQARDGFTLEVLGYVNGADGTAVITYRVANANEKDLSYVAFGTDGWTRLAPAEDVIISCGLGDYRVEWTGDQGNPGFPSVKYETQFDGFSQGIAEDFSVTVNGFDPSAPIQVQMKAGQDRTTFVVTFNGPACDQSPTPMPSPTVTSTPTPMPTPTQPGSPLPTPTSTRSSQPSTEANAAITFVAQQRGIPREKMIVVTDHATVYPNLGREFQVITLYETESEGNFYDVLVDKNTGEVVNDIPAMVKLEEQAYIARYGKMEKQLYFRLEEIGDDDILPVAIWVNGTEHRTQRQLFEAVAGLIPEAQAALSERGKPWDVDDPQLAEAIEREYNRLATADTERRIQPLLDSLQNEYGLTPTTYGSMPSMTTSLTKLQIEEVATRSDVAMVYLVEKKGQVELDVAIPTDRIPPVWNKGFEGAGVKIAILEPFKIDADVGCLNVVDQNNPSAGDGDHKTRVASVAACDDSTYRGAAPQGDILDAVFDNTSSSQQTAVEALRWAVGSSHFAPIANISYGWAYNDGDIHWIDRAFDYWARQEFVLITKSAGNEGENSGHLTSPGEGWNVMSVGGTNDKGTISWHDDMMYAASSYVNPNSPHGDRVKPEVVAPAEKITAIGLNNNPVEESGTSFAAPQVAGLAALLINRQEALSAWPEGSRAIIMASATHNIEGPSIIVPGQELKDGAGSLNAFAADLIAQNRNLSPTSPCQESCWWGELTSSVQTGQYLYRHFDGIAGQAVRITIAW